MSTDQKNEVIPFNGLQGVTSTNIPAYSNEYDDYISFEGHYIQGIFTGYKWQCVEYARRWLLLRRSCIFQSVGSAADMWQELKHVERVTDGEKFSTKTIANGSPEKPKCESFLIYPRDKEVPFGHIAIICEVQEDFIRIAEQNYRFHSWRNSYSRQIPLVKRNDLYYIEDYYHVYGWMEIENNDQLKPLNLSDFILPKYQQSKPIGKLECYSISNKQDRSFYKANEEFFLNISRTSSELYRLIKQTTENIICNDELLLGFGIPEQFWSRIRQSWNNEREFDIIDHLNFKFDGEKLTLSPHMIPSALRILEAAVLHEREAQEMQLHYDFTSSFQLHHLLVRHWKRLNLKTTVHILINHESEELQTASYIKKVMTEAGIDSKLCTFPNDLYWNDENIVDQDGQIVRIIWKFWNWEMIFGENNEDNRWKSRHSQHPCLKDILLHQQIRILEPIWKSITSHEAFIPVLYTMFPNHPNILLADSEQILSIDEQNDMNIIPYNVKDRYDDWNYYSQESFSKKTHPYSDKTMVCWIIKGLFSGFTICDDQNPMMESNNSRTYCCTV